MVEQARRKLKTKRREKKGAEAGEPSKEEYAVAKYVRFNCPSKTATIMGNEMAYFTASKAIDSLMSSKWAGDNENKLFSNRHGCVFYMQNLLDKGLFFRAKKLVPKKKDSLTTTTNGKSGRAEKEVAPEADTAGEEGKKAEKRKTKKNLEKEAKEKTVVAEKEGDEKEKTNGKKKTKKVKFDIHQNQVFNDGNDIYVWKYDPTSTKMFLLGLAMVIGSIGICLFPLWPHEVRVGVYYLSIAAMIFVGFIIILVVLRSIIFGMVWALTFGGHHFWLLPHLTDDCGFFDSFKPFYSHTIMDKKTAKIEKEGSEKDEEKENQEEEENSGAEKDSEDDNGEINDALIDDPGKDNVESEENLSEASSEDFSLIDRNSETENGREKKKGKKNN